MRVRSSHFAPWIVFSLLFCGAPRIARAEFPTLDRSIQLARSRSLVVNDANTELGIADAGMIGASVSSLGNPYSEVQLDQGFAEGSQQKFQALVYTYFPLDLAGQRGARIAEASKLIDWRKSGLADAKAFATGQVVAAYGHFVLNAARVTETTAGELAAREEAKYFAGRLEAQDTTVYEEALAGGEVARCVQARVEAELKVMQARADLAQLTGLPDIELPVGHVDLVPPTLRAAWDDEHISSVVGKSPTIARLEAERRYWETSVERYKAERTPPLVPEVIAGRGAQGELRLGAGLVFSLPITRRYQGEIARADRGVQGVSARLPVLRNIVLTRLRAARNAVVTVRRAVEELDKAGMPALERTVGASVAAFKAGKIEITRVLLARRDLATARSRRLDLLEAAWRAYADLTVFSGDLP